MKIRYLGPEAKRTIPATGQSVERDQVIDVKQQIARRLLQQSVWEKVNEDKEEE